jgi:hypothetical protein
LSKFEADVAAAENEKVFGESGELHEGLVGEIGNVFDAGDRGDAGAAADVDENFLAFEEVVYHLELMRSDKTGVAAIEAKVGALIDLFLLAAAEAEDDFVFLGDDFGEIDADV